MSGTLQDLTERKRQQLDAVAARDDLEATLRAIPDLLIELDLEGASSTTAPATPTS